MSKEKTNRSSSRLAAVQALYQYAFGEKTIDAIAREFLAGDIGGEVIAEDEITGTETFVPVMPAEQTLFAGILSAYAENADQINKMVDSSFNEEWPGGNDLEGDSASRSGGTDRFSADASGCHYYGISGCDKEFLRHAGNQSCQRYFGQAG